MKRRFVARLDRLDSRALPSTTVYSVAVLVSPAVIRGYEDTNLVVASNEHVFVEDPNLVVASNQHVLVSSLSYPTVGKR